MPESLGDFDSSSSSPGEQPPTPQSGHLGLTSASSLIVAALSGMVVSWLAVGTLQRLGETVPLLSWALPVLLGVGALVLFGYTLVFRRRLTVRRDEISPSGAVAALAAAKVSLLSGALVGGACLVYALAFMSQLQFPLPRERFIRGLVTVGCAIAFSAAGAFLERSCVAPRHPDSSNSDNPGGSD